LQSSKSCLPPPTSPSDRTLRFDSHFESGNLDLAYQTGVDSYHLILEHDSNKSGSCQWFYFQATNTRKDAKYTFVVSGFHKNRGVFYTGAKVFWYSHKQAAESNVSWSRGGTNYQYGWTLKTDTDRRCSLQFQMKFPFDADTVYLAYGVPYTYSDLLGYCRDWKRRQPDLVSLHTLCQSFGGRNCPLLDITRGDADRKEVIFLTARCHPGESNGSLLLHGFIDLLLGDSEIARYLLDQFVFRVVPMICIDGVIEGNYRVCLCGSDLNRMWMDPDRSRHPIVWAAKELMRARPPRVYVDFHGHSRMNGTFAYGCPPAAEEMKGRERLFPKLIALLSEAFAYGNCIFSMPEARLTASRCVANRELGVVESFTIESSFGGVAHGRLQSVLYDENLWKEIGAKICEAVYHLLTKGNSRLRNMAERELRLVPKPLVEEVRDGDEGNRQLRTPPKANLWKPNGRTAPVTPVALIQGSPKALCSPKRLIVFNG
jgi:hypothetical protein